MRDPQNFFTGKDFEQEPGKYAEGLSEKANAIIREHLGPRVFGEMADTGFSIWSTTLSRDEGGVTLDTHESVLFCVKPIDGPGEGGKSD